MSACCCSLAGTAACRTCSNNPYAETPPPVRTYTTIATDAVLITGRKTNADRIRQMTDEELAEFLVMRDLSSVIKFNEALGNYAHLHYDKKSSVVSVLDWLKQEVTE